ncbi:MAG TPA: alpha/beta fold hydrolase [Chloroflexia bacterium]|nr:alpha/beta fold hydrolase [Chloroflexia bacterium]
MSHASNPWMQIARPKADSRLRLFCFPYAGGGASIYRSWTDSLPASVEVVAVQLPGREGRLGEKPVTSLVRLRETLGEVLLPYLDRPFAFFGHSMGALIGFEVACHLRREAGLVPAHLFFSGRHAPQLPGLLPPVHRLSDEAFVDQINRRYNGIPKAILQEPELMQLFLPLLRADFTLIEDFTYTPEAPFECPVTAYGGWQDSLVSFDGLAGWRVQAAGAFSQQMLPGDHFFLQSARPQLLNHLSQALMKHELI